MSSVEDATIRFQLRLDGLAQNVAGNLAAGVRDAVNPITRIFRGLDPDQQVPPHVLIQARQELVSVEPPLIEASVNEITQAQDVVTELSPVALAQAEPTSEGEDSSLAAWLALIPAVAAAIRSRKHDGRTFQEWATRQARMTTARVRTNLNPFPDRGGVSVPVTEGLVGDVFVRRLNATVRLSIQSYTSLANTAVNSAGNLARMDLLRRHPGRFTKWRYTAVLDNRTSKVCQGLSGTVWSLLDDSAPFPPRHPNCRSVVVPIDDRQPDLFDENYEQWLRRQSVAEQRDVLGATRFTAWKRGLPLSDMATFSRPLNIQELKNLFPVELGQ